MPNFCVRILFSLSLQLFCFNKRRSHPLCSPTSSEIRQPVDFLLLLRTKFALPSHVPRTPWWINAGIFADYSYPSAFRTIVWFGTCSFSFAKLTFYPVASSSSLDFVWDIRSGEVAHFLHVRVCIGLVWITNCKGNGHQMIIKRCPPSWT